MRIAVLGAAGRTGALVVEEAARGGAHVVAVARRAQRDLPVTARGVVLDLGEARPEPLAEALAGCDAVVSALGHRASGDAQVLERGARVAVEAMRLAGVRRLLVVSAAPVAGMRAPDRPDPRPDPGDDLPTRLLLLPIVRRVLGEVYRDTARMESVVRASGLDWTLARPPRLLDGPGRGAVRTALDRNVRGGRSVSRAQLASWLVQAVDDRALVGHAVGIAAV